jgi:hypothetical protein
MWWGPNACASVTGRLTTSNDLKREKKGMRPLPVATALILTSICLTLSPIMADEIGERPSAATARSSSGMCSPTQVQYTTSNLSFKTKSTEDVAIKDSRMTINQAELGCVIVTVSAEAHADQTYLTLSVILDDTVVAEPGGVFFTPEDGFAYSGIQARSFSFVLPNVAPGPHKLELRVNSSSGRLVRLDYRTIVAHHE